MFGGTGGSYYFSQKCRPGKKISNFSGRGGGWVDQVVAQCEDGSYLGPIGGAGGSLVAATTCSGGYTGASITYGSFIGKLSLTCSSGTGATIGSGSASGSGQTKIFQCPNNQMIIGIRGKASDYVDSLSFICGSNTIIAAPSAAPVRPTAQPTMEPTIDNSLPIFARYIKLTRVYTSPDGSDSINILGIDIYDIM